MRSLQDLCAAAPTRQFATDEVILEEGKWSGRMYVLVDGAVEVVRGETRVATLSEPGAVVGEMAVLMDRPHTATVRATAPTRAHEIADATGFLEANPEMSFHLARLLARRLNAATTYLADLKRQFEGKTDHFGMVGEVLDALMSQQDDHFEFAPDKPAGADPRL